MQTLRVIDFESTGIAPPEAAVCEVGWCDLVTYGGDNLNIREPIAMLVDPGRPMPHEARAVHHLSEFDCAGEPQAAQAFMRLTDGADVFVAHNASFEQQFFAGGETPWICTFKCARRAWPDLPSFGNQYLRYALDVELVHDLAMPPHRAGPDAYVTAHILAKLLAIKTVDELVKWTSMPVHYPVVPMTAHRGKKWSEVDYGLLKWFTNQDHVEADIKAAARAEMKLRDAHPKGRF